MRWLCTRWRADLRRDDCQRSRSWQTSFFPTLNVGSPWDNFSHVLGSAKAQTPYAIQWRGSHCNVRAIQANKGRRFVAGRFLRARDALLRPDVLEADSLGELLLAGLAIPLLERLVRNLAFDQQLSELSPLRLALEWHYPSLTDQFATVPMFRADAAPTTKLLSSIVVDIKIEEDSGCMGQGIPLGRRHDLENVGDHQVLIERTQHCKCFMAVSVGAIFPTLAGGQQCQVY